MLIRPEKWDPKTNKAVGRRLETNHLFCASIVLYSFKKVNKISCKIYRKFLIHVSEISDISGCGISNTLLVLPNRQNFIHHALNCPLYDSPRQRRF